MRRKLGFKDFRFNLQIAVAVVLASYLAMITRLSHPMSAGIVTLLTIQNTKKDTIKVAIRRIISFLTSLIVARLMFGFFGFNYIVYGMYIFIIFTISSFLDLSISLSPNVVLGSHIFLEGSIGPDIFINELYLFAIGISFGVIINLMSPVKSLNFNEEIDRVDNILIDFLELLSDRLVGIYKIDGIRVEKEVSDIYYDKKITELKDDFKNSENKIINSLDNAIFKEEKYYLKYIRMRRSQLYILEDIFKETTKLYIATEQARLVSSFLKDIVESFHKSSTAEKLYLDSNLLLGDLKDQELPKTREEFENRAVLYGIVHNIIVLLSEKKGFVSNLSQYEKDKYWEEKNF